MTSKGINWCNKIVDIGLIIFALLLPISLSGMEVGYYLAFLAWISKMVIQKEFKLPSTPLDLPIIFFWIISFISIIFSIEPSESVERLRKIPLFFLPYLMVDSISDEKRVLRLIQILVISSALTAGLGVKNSIISGERAYSSIGSYYIFWVNPLATFMLMVLPFSITLAAIKKSFSLRTVNVLISAIILMCIVLGYTRSTYVAILGIIIFLCFLLDKKQYKYLIVLFLLMVILFAFTSKIYNRFKEVSNDGSVLERLSLWRIGWEMFKDYPLTGVGIDCIETEFPKYISSQYRWPVRGNFHNDYIQEMAEKGIGGLGAFLWLFGSFFLVTLNVYKKSLNKTQKRIALGCLLGFVGFMIIGFFESSLFVPKILRLWLFIMGIGLVMNKFCFMQERLNGDFKKILVIKLREIGDTIITTLAIKAIRKKYPDCFLSVLVPEESSGVLLNNPNINEIIFYDKEKSIIEYLSLIWKLRRRRFDLVINLHASHRSALIAYFSGARFRVIYNHNGRSYYANIPIQVFSEIPKTAIEKDLIACKAIGVEMDDNTTEVFPGKDDCKIVEELLKSKGIDLFNDTLVAIFIGAREDIRCWSLEKYISLYKYFQEIRGIKVLLVYGPREEDKIKYIIENMEKPPIVVGNLSLLQLASLFSKCKLFIGNNSGPKHIAIAMKIPTITICVPKYIEEWHPYDTSQHKIASKYINCKECERNFCDEKTCLEEISVEDVIKIVETFSFMSKTVRLN